MIRRGLTSTKHPVLAQIIPIRRCNLACTYCNEYDDHSPPVATDEMLRRIDKLADLGVSIITFSGGEPLMHPDLDDLIRRIRERGVISSLITNGLLLTPKRIEAFNDAGLEYLQISIDNVVPDETSKKSLRVLDKKLAWLGEYSDFEVNINSVVGGGVNNPEDAYQIAVRARELGHTSTVGIIHDGSGQLKPLSDFEREVYDRINQLGQRSYSRLNSFQENIANGKENDWRCRAGARYLYICEDGLVHYCSQQRGKPGIPLAEYTPAHIREAYYLEKGCAPKCTIACVHKSSRMDTWRGRQRPGDGNFDTGGLVQLDTGN